MSIQLIAAAVFATVVGLVGAYAWDADRALKREHDLAQAATMQRDAFAKGLTQCRADVAEHNRTLMRFTALPEVRKRLCAQRGIADVCCRPAPAPPATDECKP